GFRLVHDELSVTHKEQFSTSPSEIMRMFLLAGKERKNMYVYAQSLAVEVLSNAEQGVLSKSEQANTYAAELFTDPQASALVLEQMLETGALQSLIPELYHISGRVQRDLYHTYTVDAHLVYC